MRQRGNLPAETNVLSAGLFVDFMVYAQRQV